MTVNNASIIEVRDIESADFYHAMKLYEDLFPEEERLSIESIQELLKKGIYRLFTLTVAPNSNIIGFALVMSSHDPDFLFIDNLAIDKSLQGKGLGSYFIKQLSQKQDHSSLGIFIEVEKVEFAINDEDRQIREKRLQLYRKLGFIPFKGIKYLFPVKGDNPIPLILMFMPAPGVKGLGARTVKQMIKSIYYNIHSDANNLDDLYNSFQHTISDQWFE